MENNNKSEIRKRIREICDEIERIYNDYDALSSISHPDYEKASAEYKQRIKPLVREHEELFQKLSNIMDKEK